jgi:hypothetical protein
MSHDDEEHGDHDEYESGGMERDESKNMVDDDYCLANDAFSSRSQHPDRSSSIYSSPDKPSLETHCNNPRSPKKSIA